MQEHASRGQAAYALVQNTIIQAQSRTAYWVSGGACSPGTSSTEITTKVDQGQVNINGSPVNFTGGEPIHPAADANPRVDVVSVTSTGDFDVTAGTPEGFAPTTDENGDAIQSHTPFNHWTPSPNAGADVQGVPLALVLVRPDTTAGTDLTADEVDDDILRIDGATRSGYVRGDGNDNGSVTITANDADFAVQDQTDTNSKYLWRDHDEGQLNIGAPNATPTLGENLDANGENVDNVNEFGFAADSNQNIDFHSTASDGTVGTFRLRDESAGFENVITVDGTHIHHRRPTDFHDTVVSGVQRFDLNGTRAGRGGESIIDLTESETGSHVLWEVGDGSASPKTYYGHANPAGGTIFSLNNRTDKTVPFRVSTNGQVQIQEGGLGVDGGVTGQSLTATGPEMSAPSAGWRIYTKGATGNLVAKYEDGTETVLATAP